MRYALLVYSVPGSYEALNGAEREAASGEYMALATSGGASSLT